MKLVVVKDKYGEQINLQIPLNWQENDVINNDGSLTNKFIHYFDDIINARINNPLYFEEIFYVNTDEIIKGKTLFSTEYYKSDPLNRANLYGK